MKRTRSKRSLQLATKGIMDLIATGQLESGQLDAMPQLLKDLHHAHGTRNWRQIDRAIDRLCRMFLNG